jgi:hypothetical protein
MDRPAPPEAPAGREAACCHAEPECVLCPLRPENAARTVAELRAAGLYAEQRAPRL